MEITRLQPLRAGISQIVHLHTHWCCATCTELFQCCADISTTRHGPLYFCTPITHACDNASSRSLLAGQRRGRVPHKVQERQGQEAAERADGDEDGHVGEALGGDAQQLRDQRAQQLGRVEAGVAHAHERSVQGRLHTLAPSTVVHLDDGCHGVVGRRTAALCKSLKSDLMFW